MRDGIMTLRAGPKSTSSAGKYTVKVLPSPGIDFDVEAAAVPVHDVLDDREPEPGAAQIARARASTR